MGRGPAGRPGARQDRGGGRGPHRGRGRPGRRGRGGPEVADAAKPASAEAVARLRAPGPTPIPLTGDHRAAADAIRPASRTLGTIRSHLFWAFAYNAAALPPAAAGLLTPMIAGAATAFSSVFAVGNSPRLRTFGAVRSRGAGPIPGRAEPPVWSVRTVGTW